MPQNNQKISYGNPLVYHTTFEYTETNPCRIKEEKQKNKKNIYNTK